MSYERWMDEFDLICRDRFGLSIYDLPDTLFTDAFESDMTPEEFITDEIPDLDTLGQMVLG